MNKASPDNIKVFEGFMDPDHVEVIHELCKNSLDNLHASEWWYNKFPGPEYTENAIGEYKRKCELGLQHYHQEKNPLLKFYIDKVTDLISYEAGRTVVPIFNFNRHQTLSGGICPGHTDSEAYSHEGVSYLPEYSPNHLYEPAIIEFSANIYINNDYDGGSLYFPDYDITINHTPGQLVFFPGTLQYNHAVHKVENGTRWNLLTHFARPKLIQMHSIIHNLWSVLTDEQKSMFPESWNDGPQPRGVREGNT
jgi:hypothetical protein